MDRDVLRYSANLTNYQTLFHPALTVVKKGHPEESSIFKSIAIHQSMPPGKEGYDLVPSVLVKLLRLWILNCAVEDKDRVDDERPVSDPENPEKIRLCEDQ